MELLVIIRICLVGFSWETGVNWLLVIGYFTLIPNN